MTNPDQQGTWRFPYEDENRIRQEITALNVRLNWAHRMMTAAVISVGGTLKIPNSVLITMPKDCELRQQDSASGIIFTVRPHAEDRKANAAQAAKEMKEI